ncbi:hypothetical protein VIGAN_04111600 [Vigna angularis var. angularis]|uniref:HIT-type domain-containing protein n=1 Tax=Vigna angularis var. angularis TaxID=157739 RepID=A0A0S3RTE3_PHAAN|nr:hypothetical protein VIGAN_04111600 [Vigna angularis var. angularis]
MEDDGSSSIRRMSSRTRKVASKMATALASADNRTQAALARLDALENDNAGFEIADANNDDDEASLDEEDQYYIQKKQSKGTKRKTRQAKALEARRSPRTFLELLHEANLESLPPHVPSYWKAAVGPPSTTSRRHFCTVCGFSANYTCVRCGSFVQNSTSSHCNKCTILPLSGGGGINDCERPIPFSTRSAMPKPEFRCESMWQRMNQIPDLQS